MIKETDNYKIHLEALKKRFTATCLISGESIVFKQKSVGAVQRVCSKLSIMKDCDIDAMCDCDFKR